MPDRNCDVSFRKMKGRRAILLAHPEMAQTTIPACSLETKSACRFNFHPIASYLLFC